MWFKAIQVYQTNFHEQAFEFDEILKNAEAFAFEPCGRHDPVRMGWDAPNGQEEAPLIYAANGAWLFQLKIQEKIVPTATVNEQVEERVEKLVDERGKPVSKKEKAAIKDDVYHQLLPMAFTRTKSVMGYLDPITGWLVLNTHNAKQLDTFLSFLRKTLPTLSIAEIETQDVGLMLTEWLRTNSYPDTLVIEDTCVLKDHNEDSLIRCQRENLLSDDIINLLENGREVVQLSLTWQDQVRFTLTDSFQLKAVKFLEMVQDQANDILSETEQEKFDADFSVMILVVREWLQAMLHLFKQHPQESEGVEDERAALESVVE